jgi:hypothetical protein
MFKKLVVPISVLVIMFLVKTAFGQTAFCAGTGFSNVGRGLDVGIGIMSGGSLIRPSTSNVDVLMIYTYFPTGGDAGENIPSFAAAVAQHVKAYYEEMSYNTHHVNFQVIQRPTPYQGKAFLADHDPTYYQTRLSDLNTEIIDKAWQENNNVFNGIEALMMFYGGGIFSGTG